MVNASRSRAAAVLLGVCLAVCPRAWALNPALEISQYAHTAWKARDGFPGGAVRAITQTPDGFLWLGTLNGLYRFDGVSAVPWRPPSAQTRPGTLSVYSLLAAGDGALWIGSSHGLMRWKDGALVEYETPPGAQFWSLAEDREGRVWAGSTFPAPGRVCLVQQPLQCSDAGGKLGPSVAELFQDSKGNLWAGVREGVVRWKPDLPRLFPLPPQLNGYRGFVEEDGELLLGLPEGLVRFVEGKTTVVHPSPPLVRPLPASVALRDRDGGLWMGTYGRGLVHFHDGRSETFTQADGLSGNSVVELFEDREGNVWVGTPNGLDRFRDVAVPAYSMAQGLSNDLVSAVLAARDGSVWIGTYDGLNHWDRGQVTIYRAERRPTRTGAREIVASGFPERSHAMFQDTVGRIWLSGWHPAGYLENGRFVAIPGVPRDPDNFVGAIVEDDRGDIWLVTHDALVHLRNRQVLEHIPWSTFRPDGQAASAAAIDREGDGLWLGFLAGSVVRVVDGRVQATYAAANGLGTGRVHHLRVEADGTVWAATQGGLSRISNGQVVTLGAQDGLPCNEVLWSIEDDVGSVWLFMSCGLVRVARAGLDAWTASIGKEATQRQAVPFTLFGNADGIRLTSNIAAYAPQVTKAPDGRIWFSTIDAVSILDPRQLRDNPLAPPVHIEQVTADRKSYGASSGVLLPPRVRDLQISYTALSLVTPERNQFRVRLEGRDPDWQDVGTRREVFYNDLPPGAYRFRVIASNNSGVWNEAGAVLDFSIAPAYYQTTWFRTLIVLIVATILWSTYRYRLRQVAHAFNIRLDERVNERTRIARELHDTLLQSFQGLMLRFQSARDLLPAQPAKAVEALDGALDRADQAIAEGRDAIQNLRSSTVVSNELALAITTLAQELNNGHDGEQGSARFRMSVEGSPRDLHPIVRDDIHRIAREALRNAFSHAQANLIEAEVTYGPRELRLRIRDDGKGIDSEQLNTGRVRHWGLAGMRERSVQIGAQLNLWSEVGAGTEVELRIPGALAYTAPSGRGSVFRMRRKQGGGP